MCRTALSATWYARFSSFGGSKRFPTPCENNSLTKRPIRSQLSTTGQFARRALYPVWSAIRHRMGEEFSRQHDGMAEGMTAKLESGRKPGFQPCSREPEETLERVRS